ncbi:hypothetical protein Pmani_033682 [Petrolisthes manimaculis]|uniref:Uncharacterized protein n=1 Tax=Petrolisthes manimaculis TaxID=1843537 RepID=A0AAE1NQW1_9EUCA|nr:hypothetical protein Pmani_033682 [Petrolisthes manimaculis]
MEDEFDERDVLVKRLGNEATLIPAHLLLLRLSDFGEIIEFTRHVRSGGRLSKSAKVRFLTVKMASNCLAQGEVVVARRILELHTPSPTNSESEHEYEEPEPENESEEQETENDEHEEEIENPIIPDVRNKMMADENKIYIRDLP